MKCYLGLLRSLCAPYAFDPNNLIDKLAPEIAAATATVYAEIVNLLERAHENAQEAGRTAIKESDFHGAYYGASELETLWGDVRAFWEARRSDAASAVSRRADDLWPTVA